MAGMANIASLKPCNSWRPPQARRPMLGEEDGCIPALRLAREKRESSSIFSVPSFYISHVRNVSLATADEPATNDIFTSHMSTCTSHAHVH